MNRATMGVVMRIRGSHVKEEEPNEDLLFHATDKSDVEWFRIFGRGEFS